eukprot:Phypoly_transcript_03039.p1 GENE.Phypoly_transcript_03039~~Phypoly_transcript_03039.p1  ORF type:complete len:360 (+),score=52.81 Phypoly_transcript_03039:1399-2478(+)
MGDTLKKGEKDQFQKFSDGIRNAPNSIFDFGEDKARQELLEQENQEGDPGALDNFARGMQDYIDEKPKTVADGMFKGLLSIGTGVVSGVTGVFTEPVKEVQKKGAIGVFTGVGKGVSGLVTKPLAGVIDMGVKTTQGVINTPGTISRAASRGLGFEAAPPPPPPNPIFGVPHEISLQNAEKMKIVHPTITIINYIRKNGMDQQGIFRESGNVGIIKQVCDDYDRGKEPKLEEMEMREISGVLKNYLRALPEPLLSFDLYNQFLNVLRSGSGPDRDALLYKSLIKSLPPGDKLLVQSLLALLSDIAKNQDKNKMTVSNLAIVFGPSLLRPQSVNAATELFDMPDVSRVIEFFINHHVQLF